MTSEQETNTPTKNFQAGSVHASIFLDAGKPEPNISIRRRYEDPKTGEWQTSHYYNPAELKDLEDVLTEVRQWLKSQK